MRKIWPQVGKHFHGLDIIGRIRGLGYFIHLWDGFIGLTGAKQPDGYTAQLMDGYLLRVRACLFCIAKTY